MHPFLGWLPRKGSLNPKKEKRGTTGLQSFAGSESGVVADDVGSEVRSRDSGKQLQSQLPGPSLLAGADGSIVSEEVGDNLRFRHVVKKLQGHVPLPTLLLSCPVKGGN